MQPTALPGSEGIRSAKFAYNDSDRYAFVVAEHGMELLVDLHEVSDMSKRVNSWLLDGNKIAPCERDVSVPVRTKAPWET